MRAIGLLTFGNRDDLSRRTSKMSDTQPSSVAINTVLGTAGTAVGVYLISLLDARAKPLGGAFYAPPLAAVAFTLISAPKLPDLYKVSGSLSPPMLPDCATTRRQAPAPPAPPARTDHKTMCVTSDAHLNLLRAMAAGCCRSYRELCGLGRLGQTPGAEHGHEARPPPRVAQPHTGCGQRIRRRRRRAINAAAAHLFMTLSGCAFPAGMSFAVTFNDNAALHLTPLRSAYSDTHQGM